MGGSSTTPVGEIALDCVPVLGRDPVGVWTRLPDFALNGVPGTRRHAGTGTSHCRATIRRRLHSFVTGTGGEGNLSVGAFEGGGIGFRVCARRNIRCRGIFARANLKVGRRRRPSLAAQLPRFAGSGATTLLSTC